MSDREGKKQHNDRVIGVYAHAKGWEIKLVKGGKPKSEYRKTEKAARALAERRALEFEVGQELVGRTRGWRIRDEPTMTPAERITALLWAGSKRAAAKPADENIQRALKAISSAATATAKVLAVSKGDNAAPEDLDAGFWMEIGMAAAGSMKEIPEEQLPFVEEAAKKMLEAAQAAQKPSN